MRALVAVALAGALCAAQGRDNDPITNYEDMPVRARGSKPLTQAEVRDAIVAAASAKQWKVNYVAAGRLVAQRNVAGRHLVEVDIRYGPQQYSVLYRNSINMNYRATDASIHPNYNRWARELVDGINFAIYRTRSE
jgi:hypothetical protein